jgi:hypothetical protein
MKQISNEQIQAVLQTVYSTNIPASQFDALKELFSKLEDVKEEKPEKK